MKDVFVSTCNIFSPLGKTSAENFLQLKRGISGVRLYTDSLLSAKPFYASLFDEGDDFPIDPPIFHTRFEKLLIGSIREALEKSEIDPGHPKTGMVITSTKGNIGLLETRPLSRDLIDRIALPTSAGLVSRYFGFKNPPVIISNACISGLLGIIVALRMIRGRDYEHVVVAGADLVTRFVLSGFQALEALSPLPCVPFDADRAGINLGEGAATIILTGNPKYSDGVRVLAGSVSNDANHISAPSRNGEGLGQAIKTALWDSGLSAHDIDLVSAHGTGTPYNDEMEAKALNLNGLHHAPVNSLKGYFGHTLGAAGILESVASICSLKENLILPSMGFKRSGVTVPVNICTSLLETPLRNLLKTASGFGGCNAAVAYSKN